MKQIFLNPGFLLVIAVLLIVSGCEEETEPILNPDELEINEFTLFPAQPTIKDEVSMVFNGCSYFHTTSIIVNNTKIDVRKHFNSRLALPCETLSDTVSIGKLKQGEYTVTLEIIDLNSLVTDSVFNKQVQTLTVTNK